MGGGRREWWCVWGSVRVKVYVCLGISLWSGASGAPVGGKDSSGQCSGCSLNKAVAVVVVVYGVGLGCPCVICRARHVCAQIPLHGNVCMLPPPSLNPTPRTPTPPTPAHTLPRALRPLSPPPPPADRYEGALSTTSEESPTRHHPTTILQTLMSKSPNAAGGASPPVSPYMGDGALRAGSTSGLAFQPVQFVGLGPGGLGSGGLGSGPGPGAHPSEEPRGSEESREGGHWGGGGADVGPGAHGGASSIASSGGGGGGGAGPLPPSRGPSFYFRPASSSGPASGEGPGDARAGGPTSNPGPHVHPSINQPHPHPDPDAEFEGLGAAASVADTDTVGGSPATSARASVGALSVDSSRPGSTHVGGAQGRPSFATWGLGAVEELTRSPATHALDHPPACLHPSLFHDGWYRQYVCCCSCACLCGGGGWGWGSTWRSGWIGLCGACM